MDDTSVHGIPAATIEATEEPMDEMWPKLLAGVFLMEDGELTVSGMPGTDPGLLFIEAIKGMYINLKKPQVLKADGPLPPVPPELAR